MQKGFIAVPLQKQEAVFLLGKLIILSELNEIPSRRLIEN